MISRGTLVTAAVLAVILLALFFIGEAYLR